LSQYVERSVAQDRSRAAELFWNLVVLRLILALLGIGSITFAAAAVGYPPVLVVGVLLLTATYIFAAFLRPILTILTANELFTPAIVAQVVGQVLTVGIGLGFLALGHGFLALLYAGLIVLPVQIALCWWAVRTYELGPLSFSITPRQWPALARAALPFGLISLALTYNFNVDTVILGFWRSDAEVGWYSAAYRLVFNLVGLLGGFLVALSPSLAREYVSNPDRVAGFVRKSVQCMALFSLPTAVGVSLLAEPIAVLLYGEPYRPSGAVLSIICWDAPLLLFNAFCGNLAGAMNLERSAARIYLLSAATNIVLNVLLIPSLGMFGAATTTIVSDSLSLLSFAILLSSKVQMSLIGGRLVRTALAAGLMGVIVWHARMLDLPFSILSGMISFTILGLLLRIIDPLALGRGWKRIVGGDLSSAGRRLT
jgi:O-antigen/teichoic acid export membrane protein